MSKYRERLLAEELSREEILARRAGKLERERHILFRDYDDSSDEEESLNYKKIPKSRIDECKDEIIRFRLFKFSKMKHLRKILETREDPELRAELEILEKEKEELEQRLDDAKKWQAENPIFLMETEGRKAIYKHLSGYRDRKSGVFGETKFDIKDAAQYNSMFVDALERKGLITAVQVATWKAQFEKINGFRELINDESALSFLMETMCVNEVVVFTEDNKFQLLRRFLRQTNRERVDQELGSTISEFAKAVGATGMLSDE
jgi:hypothetical protein